MNRITVIIVGVVIILIASFVGLFFTYFERYSEEQNIDFSGEAKKNKFYAAELFLARYDMEIISLGSILELKKMPGKKDVLFIPTKRFDISEDRITELLEWVKKGGHLVVLARYSYNEDDELSDILFERLGVRAQQKDVNQFLEMFSDMLDESEVDSEIKSETPKNGNTDLGTEDLTTEFNFNKQKDTRSKREIYESKVIPIVVKVNDKIEDKRVYFNQKKWMQNESSFDVSWSVDGKNGAQLLELKIENGWVTLLSDIGFLTNKRIDKFDHAAFLHTIVHIDDSSRKLWIIRNDDSPSLLSLLFINAASAMSLFLVFIFIWLWYASRRFGPMAPKSQAIRRSMSEHITSTGHFQWRNKNRSELLESVQKALHEQIAQMRPLWVKLPEPDLAEKLAKVTGIEKQRILNAITVKRIEKELEFTATIEVLSIIRKKL